MLLSLLSLLFFFHSSFSSLVLAILHPPQVEKNKKYEKISLVWSFTRV